jgi:large subunit ribosomal protein L21
MYAVVNTGGKQAKVEKGTILAVERLSAEVGETVSLPVIFVADGDAIYATPDETAGASVSAEVLEHFKGEKLIVFKFKKRKGYKRTKGHRQALTSVRILDIALTGGAAAKADKPKKEDAPAKSPKAEKAPKAPKAEKAEKAPAAEKPAKAPAAEKTPKAPKAEKAEKAPAVEAGLCAATKADGSPCTNKAKEGSEFCGVHANKSEG